MPDAYVISERDAVVIRSMLEQHRNRVQNPRNRTPSHIEDLPGPAFYVAKATTGIPALSGGTGTAPYQPGYAECEVYRLDEVQGTGTSLLQELSDAGFTVTVNNLGSSAVATGAWFHPAQDKWGKWWAVASAGDGSSAFSGASVGNVTNTPLLANATDVHLEFSRASFDTDSYFSIGLPTRLTIPSSGYYQYGATVVFGAGVTASTMRTVNIAGGNPGNCIDRRESPALDGVDVTISSLSKFIAGDYLELLVSNGDPASGIGVTADMWIHKVG